MDWNKIKTEYITTDASYRDLAEKYDVPRVTIGRIGKAENWVELRRQHEAKVLTKTLTADIKRKTTQMQRIKDATDKLLDKIEQAIDELDLQMVKRVHKEKVIEYNNLDRPDKPTKEIIDEQEELTEIRVIVDRSGIKQIASALRDIKETQMIKSDLDMREQEARIAALERQAGIGDDDDDETGVIILPEVIKRE